MVKPHISPAALAGRGGFCKGWEGRCELVEVARGVWYHRSARPTAREGIRAGQYVAHASLELLRLRASCLGATHLAEGVFKTEKSTVQVRPDARIGE